MSTGDGDMEGSCIRRLGIFYPYRVVSCVTFLRIVYRQRNLCIRFSKFISEESSTYQIRNDRGLVDAVSFNFSYINLTAETDTALMRYKVSLLTF